MTQNNTPKRTRPKAGRGRQAVAHRRMLFVEAYIANGNNATEAAKQASYKETGAHTQGPRLLKDDEVRKILAQRQAEIAKKFALTAENVIAELSKIVHADMRKLFTEDGKLLPMDQWPEDIASAISSVEIDELFAGRGNQREQIGFTKKLKLWDKNSALTLAMRHLGMLIDRSEVTHRVDIADRIHRARKRSGSE